jgi:hypothetical protein
VRRDVGDRAEVLDTLAAGYAEVGDFNRAIDTAELARKRAADEAKPQLEAQIRARAELYRRGQPYRQPK